MPHPKSQNIRVLIMNKYFDAVGGVEDTVRQLYEINNNTVETFVIASTFSGKKVSVADKNRVFLCKTWVTFFRAPIAPKIFSTFQKKIESADVVNIHMPSPFSELVVLFYKKRLKSKKIILTYHADILGKGVVGFFYGLITESLFTIADKIVATSPHLAEKSKLLKKFSSKVIVIPNAPNLPLAISESVQTKDFTYFLFVGRLVSYKGLEYLLEAIKNIPAKLVIAGDGPLRKKLSELVCLYGLIDRVEMLGFVEDKKLDELYRNASAFVFPSVTEAEALGLVQLSAMAYGLPVINTDLPTGVPWVARDGIEAITVPCKDSGALEQALIKVYSDYDLRVRLGDAGKKRYKENFTVGGMKERYEKLYTACVVI